ncbi:Nicotinate phosphoribosyltransferase (modular protein) [Nitrospina gracilis 3/211]|uniref:nicotinate phosphoribosyltransferase n=2 Tax=Nitrospinaceae TaxID=407032 RepID=M1YJ77_NITG3|nr:MULTISPECIES: nicotinate phosphoribosyltransferase [Nitrospina]MCF8723491.1 putative nicotinate phosphoribosyltransferase [Nitrospina sp. Nb-3]CCQ90560.1 Nicotinate phosphoribosyltransferase (modular protein) [Nitrospina gracilis 3/211]
MKDLTPQSGDALLIVDLQNDFLPGGSLAVPHGDQVIAPLKRYADFFRSASLPIFASRDWHPETHCSFEEQGGPWPPHCIQGTEGADFAAELNLADTVVISKAQTEEADAYSAFQGTDLDSRLKEKGVRRLFIGGLATDYCVLNTVRDAVKNTFEVVLLQDAIRAVNVNPEDEARALNEMRELGCRFATVNDICLDPAQASALLTDLYQLTMLKSYNDQGMTRQAVFEFFVRDLPPHRNFLMCAGVEPVLRYLEALHFSPQELDALKRSGRFPQELLDSLRTFRFTGDVDAMPEGTVFFANEPVLRITAPLPEAQFVETRIINLLHYSILVASKAARCVLAAQGRGRLVDFGLRRAHGAEAGWLAARSSFLAGFDGTATVLAEATDNIPVYGTMAHSYIQAHDSEEAAFYEFCRSWPQNTTLLLDTYDVFEATESVIRLSRKLEKNGIRIQGVRLDSGDMQEQAREVRRRLDEAGLEHIKIFVSGNLDEHAIAEYMANDIPVEGFGIGTRLVVSDDAPFLECAYKLQEYDGKPRRKRSKGKATLPGAKQVFRLRDAGGRFANDQLGLAAEELEGETLIAPMMRGGRRLHPSVSLQTLRAHAQLQLMALPEPLRSLGTAAPSYPVTVSENLKELTQKVDRQTHASSLGLNGSVFRTIADFFRKAF